MGKTIRSWQKRTGWKDSRHQVAKRNNFGKGRDRFRFDPKENYRQGE